MAGRPLAKKALAELESRGGPQALQEALLSGKTIPQIAREIGLDKGYLRRLLLKNEAYGNAIREVQEQIADAHADASFEYLHDVHTRRLSEIEQAIGGDRDIAEANVSQVDLGIAKGLASQHNFIAAAYNKAKYGTGSQQNVQINIGDLHLDALRKMKVIQSE
jgi:hypothetical protein|tara:strand:- start:409 stop:897 length:489 start_codon:yes stop_codon:yes gene_type:complete